MKLEEKKKKKKKKEPAVSPKAQKDLEDLHSQTQQALDKMTAENASKMAAGQVRGILFTHASPVAKLRVADVGGAPRAESDVYSTTDQSQSTRSLVSGGRGGQQKVSLPELVDAR